jgi:Thiolase, N-terminal domain/3-hydroxyacyl-CoA dehydrogenase, C-terminal domain/3-hydroxyacyl-CoA dehydrogenase, NAD binding domain
VSEDVFLVDGVRTPLGRYGGALAGVRPDDLAALAVAEVVSRSGVPADAVDEVILGAANQAGEDNRDVARMAVLLAGLSDTVPGYTVNRLCASGLTAVASAAQAIRSGDADVMVAGGVESMTRAPWVMAKPGTPWARPGEVADTSLGWRFTNPRLTAADNAIEAGAGPEVSKVTLPMGETAEEVAALDHITRADSDAFALSITELAAPLAHPRRFLGMHFFNPVPSSELVELVSGPETDPSTVRTARNCVHALGKSDVVVRDSPGFATSRLGVTLGLEAIRMLEDGVADPESIDRAMELGYRHPMGPLRSTDLVGLDVRLAIAEHLHTTLGDRFRPPQLLRDKVTRGELGRKTGQGFYRWPS